MIKNREKKIPDSTKIPDIISFSHPSKLLLRNLVPR